MTENELNRIIELFGNNVFQTAFCYMKSCADAEDVREEAFIKLYLSGKSFDSGLATGINQNSWQVSNAAKNSALAAKNAFNSTLQIKSPSRVMKKSGGFFVAGIATGIAESIDSAEREVTYMANKLTGTVDNIFSDYQMADISPNLDIESSISSDIDARLRQSEMRQEMREKDDNEPIALTVKIGEETILDRIVNGIKEKSFMENMGVVGI